MSQVNGVEHAKPTLEDVAEPAPVMGHLANAEARRSKAVQRPTARKPAAESQRRRA